MKSMINCYKVSQGVGRKGEGNKSGKVHGFPKEGRAASIAASLKRGGVGKCPGNLENQIALLTTKAQGEGSHPQCDRAGPTDGPQPIETLLRKEK